MSAVAAIRALLAAHAPLVAVVPAARIMAGDIPLSFVPDQLPAISVMLVSGTPRNTVSMLEPSRLYTDRVQVSLLVRLPGATPSGQGYPLLDTTMPLILAACPTQRATVGGLALDSILPDLEGPDLSDMTVGFVQRSRDFIVKFRAA